MRVPVHADLVTGGDHGVELLRERLDRVPRPEPGDRQLAPLEELQQLAAVFGMVKTDYVEPVDEKKLISDAIGGMVAGLDPHSQYFDKTTFKEFREGTTGKFVGVGIEIGTSFGPLHGRVWRIGTMGYNARKDAVLTTLATLEAVLPRFGAAVPAGGGVEAAADIYAGAA